MPIVIGIDLMGSDSSPEALFEAALEVSGNTEGSTVFVLFATKEVAGRLLNSYSEKLEESRISSRIDFCLVNTFISMEDDPLSSLRFKKDSSLAVGIQSLKQGKINAFVTAGNTGALIAFAATNLALLKGCDRPALLAVLPTRDTPLAVIDVGGNISYQPENLVQYALIAAAYQRCALGKKVARVGLLNVGIESKKGTSEVRKAFTILQDKAREADSKIDFIGNIEGREVFQGVVDVLVTDGFTGNVLLKTSEGISAFIFEYLQEMLKDSPSKEVHQALDSHQRHFSYEEYPGALVCGVDGIVMKCHGEATTKAMRQSILGAIDLVQNQLLSSLRES